MPDLAQTINFGSALHTRLAEGCAIDRRQSLHFHLVFENGDSGLNDFLLTAIGRFRKAEAITADHDSIVQYDAMADTAKFANRDVRMSSEIIADVQPS